MGHRRAIKEIRHLEADIKKWQVLVDKVRGDNSPDFDNQTLAVLRGRLVRYLMRSKEVSIKIDHYTVGLPNIFPSKFGVRSRFGPNFTVEFVDFDQKYLGRPAQCTVHSGH